MGLLAQAKTAIRSLFTMGRDRQNFLGANWIPISIKACPERLRQGMALRILSLSPHYFFPENGEVWLRRKRIFAEDSRNRTSRQRLFHDVIKPYVKSDFTVVDYGCGPGYLAKETARHVRQVIACDISSGVLACARTLNGSDNLRYVNVSDYGWEQGISADLIYSIAVAQHLSDSVLKEVLTTLHGIIKPGGFLLLHVVVNAEGWRSESDWLNDQSITGRFKIKYGLNCFTRTPEQVIALAECAGFKDCTMEPMSRFSSADSDLAIQHLLISRA